MELGLSLGDSNSRPFAIDQFNEKPRDHHQASSSSQVLGSGFNTTLSIGPTQRDHQQQEKAKPKKDNIINSSNNNSDRGEVHHEATDEYPSLSSKSINPVLHQLDLLPRLSFPWLPPSENGSLSTEFGGSSRGLDVNAVPVAAAAAEDEGEEGAALSSSPNSAASSFQMDLCIYSRGGGGGSLSGSGGNNNKRELSDGERGSISRASDEDENGTGGSGSNSTRKKLRLSKDQSAFLEESFKEHNTLNPKQKLALAKQLNLRPRQVEVWFQNRRARTKLKQTEVDCEYLKRCCETLTEENRRLHKELQELRALKTSNPFYMQLPATTLTMCPSCERVATNSTATNSSVTTSATINANNNNTTEDHSNSKASSVSPFGKPRFHPFAHTSPHHLELN